MNDKTNDFRKINMYYVAIFDLVILHIGFIAAFIVKFCGKLPAENFNPYLMLIPFISIAFIFLCNIYGLYTIENKSMGDIASSLFLSIVILQLVTATGTFFIRRFAFPRTIFVISFVFQFAFLVLWRYFIFKIYVKQQKNKKVIIIGEQSLCQKLIEKLKKSSYGEGCVKKIIETTNIKEVSRDLSKNINKSNVVYICSHVSSELRNEIVKLSIAFKKEIYIIPDFNDILFVNSKLIQLDDISLVRVLPLELTMEQKFLKRVFDIIIAVVGIILCSPFILFSALLIKATSKGPVLYRQKRVTYGGGEFDILKFRTMFVDAEKITGPVLSNENDPRITKVGKFLRAIRFDEIPQFINVLKGDMSFIGPRPERPYFVDKFNKDYSEYVYRHNVKAGITGLAQVMGRYSTEVSDKLRFDLIYIKNYSFLLDIKIFLLTIKIIFLKSASK